MFMCTECMQISAFFFFISAFKYKCGTEPFSSSIRFATVKRYSYTGRAQIFLKFCWAKYCRTIHGMSAKQLKSHFTFLIYKEVQQGLVLPRFVLRWFTFTTLVQSDRALPVYHCRNSRVLSLLSARPVLFRCARVSSFSILVQFF
jgi:hypothetical protein